MPEYSIVIPVYNEQESLPELYAQLSQVMKSLEKPYEIIFMDDCSSDGSIEIMAGFQLENPDAVRVLRLPERSGQTMAIKKGFQGVRGRIAVTLDADLQNDPADIPKLLKKINEGYDVVCGWRKSRQDKPLKMALSKLGNVLQRSISGFGIHDVSCTLRAYRRECLDKIPLNWEGQHRFIPLSLHLQEYKIGEIVSNHRKRRFGYSKYNHGRIFRVIADFFKVLFSRGKK
jgi:glycosyltransferase involved in cell wall biosynthesis